METIFQLRDAKKSFLVRAKELEGEREFMQEEMSALRSAFEEADSSKEELEKLKAEYSKMEANFLENQKDLQEIAEKHFLQERVSLSVLFALNDVL